MTEQILNLVLKQGIIISTIFLFWIVWLICFIGAYISDRKFERECNIGRARVESYARDDEGGYNMYVYLLDLDDGKTYLTRFSNMKKYPVGSELNVAYKKDFSGYEIRLPNKHVASRVTFILQLLFLLVLVALKVYSTFINPNFYMI